MERIESEIREKLACRRWLDRSPADALEDVDRFLLERIRRRVEASPLLTPDRWLADFEQVPFKDDVRPLILKHNAARLLGLD